jgi:hypothetical protein
VFGQTYNNVCCIVGVRIGSEALEGIVNRGSDARPDDDQPNARCGMEITLTLHKSSQEDFKNPFGGQMRFVFHDMRDVL